MGKQNLRGIPVAFVVAAEPMRSLVGMVNALQICKDCQRELKREARQKHKAGETDAILPELREDFMDMDEDDLELMFDKLPTTASAKGAGKKGIPYDELDANIVKLVQALNRYPGVMTVGSCGGHEVITNPFHSITRFAIVDKYPVARSYFTWHIEVSPWTVNKSPTVPKLRLVGRCG